MKFLGRRALHSILLFAGASVLAFLLVRLSPGDYFESMRINPQISNRTIVALRAEYGLNKPSPVLYWHWVQSALKGEGGFSFSYNSPAGAILWPRARNTLLLTSCATLLAWAFALIAGMLVSTRNGGVGGLLAGGITALLLAIPEVVLALLILLFAVHAGFPAGGMMSPDMPAGWGGISRDVARHLFLPAVCLAGGLVPLLLSHIRAAMEEALRSPFILAARGHGIPFRRILFRHAFRAALNPIISLFGLSIGLLMSSSLIVEAIFSWPGLGQLMLQAIADRDLFLIIDSTMVAVGFLIAGNFIADLLLYWSDPRIRA